ncbi:hypothetical protein A8144_05085 [Mycobacterium leprae 3125609]|nr:hypothetical protein A8144_05085 [Mycobacterium leprae 3125609]OAX71784.1 hypothetical protein A3216_03805 [Mycobacterium leprae 7935681]
MLILLTLCWTDRDIRGGSKQVFWFDDSIPMAHLSWDCFHPYSDRLCSKVQIVCQLVRTLVRRATFGAVGTVRR